MTIGIGELADRTGLSQQVVRAWETRYGFPAPARSAGGRRVYAESEVERVRRVLALKRSGVRLAEAVERVQSAVSVGSESVYATVRTRHPRIGSRTMRRGPLVAISKAIEDEAMSRVERPVVFGSFQREAFFRESAARWNEIARTAAACVVFADFAEPGGGSGRPVEVPLAPDAPLLREWAVVVTAPSLSVLLTAWEVPDQSQSPARDRIFESMFTFDPAAVRTAAQVCASAATASGVSIGSALDEAMATEPTTSHGVDSLVMRAFDYLQHPTTVDP